MYVHSARALCGSSHHHAVTEEIGMFGKSTGRVTVVGASSDYAGCVHVYSEPRKTVFEFGLYTPSLVRGGVLHASLGSATEICPVCRAAAVNYKKGLLPANVAMHYFKVTMPYGGYLPEHFTLSYLYYEVPGMHRIEYGAASAVGCQGSQRTCLHDHS